MPRTVLLAFCSAFVLAAACGDASSQGAAAPGAAAPAGAAAPVETRPANAANLKPAFPGQTRAPALKTSTALQVQTLTSDLQNPWGLAFLPDGRMLITEKPGRLNLMSADGKSRTQIAGLPPVDARGQGGLLDVALSPDFASSGMVYWCYSEPGARGMNSTAAARGKLVLGDKPRLEQVQVVFSQKPKLSSTLHYGCRFAFPKRAQGGDGTFFLTLGERSTLEGRRQAQRLDGHLGKVVRLNFDGSVPADNPFARGGGLPEIWSYGLRNVQSAAIAPDGRLWTVEHGPKGGDELNHPEKGKDYGWPTISYGVEYAGGPIGQGVSQQAGMEQPVYYWDPVIAPSGMTFYTADLIPEWKGSVFIGGLRVARLVRLTLQGDRVTGEEWLLDDEAKRIRDVRQGPDGALYLLTDEGDLMRVAPA
jgi:aldose sugar dehydrogenase